MSVYKVVTSPRGEKKKHLINRTGQGEKERKFSRSQTMHTYDLKKKNLPISSRSISDTRIRCKMLFFFFFFFSRNEEHARFGGLVWW